MTEQVKAVGDQPTVEVKTPEVVITIGSTPVKAAEVVAEPTKAV